MSKVPKARDFLEDLEGEGVDEQGFASSPEHVTDDEVFDEEDFQPLERTIDAGGERFWEVEECIDVFSVGLGRSILL